MFYSSDKDETFTAGMIMLQELRTDVSKYQTFVFDLGVITYS